MGIQKKKKIWLVTIQYHTTWICRKQKLKMILALSLFLVVLHTSSSSVIPKNDCFPRNWKYAWSKVGNTWLTFLKTKGTWSEMEKQCRAIEPGRTMLASPRTKDEHSHLLSIMKRENEAEVWLGGIRLDRTEKFHWYRDNGKTITLEQMRNTFWLQGEPNNSGGHEDCVMMYSGGWNNQDCSYSHPA